MTRRPACAVAVRRPAEAARLRAAALLAGSGLSRCQIVIGPQSGWRAFQDLHAKLLLSAIDANSRQHAPDYSNEGCFLVIAEPLLGPDRRFDVGRRAVRRSVAAGVLMQ